MRLPLRTVRNLPNRNDVGIADASGQMVAVINGCPDVDKVADMIVRRMNGNWLTRWFRPKVVEYSREDWLFEKGFHHSGGAGASA